MLVVGVDVELQVIFGVENLVAESAGVGEAAGEMDALYVFSRRVSENTSMLKKGDFLTSPHC